MQRLWGYITIRDRSGRCLVWIYALTAMKVMKMARDVQSLDQLAPDMYGVGNLDEWIKSRKVFIANMQVSPDI